MRLLYKTLSFFIVIIVFILLLDCSKNNVYTSAEILPKKQINVAVALSNINDPFLSLVHKNLDEIQNKTDSNVKYTFYDGENNQLMQNMQIDSILNGNYDLLLVNLVDLRHDTVASIINNVKTKNIPIILFNLVPFETEPIKSYKKAIAISSNVEESGILEGKLVIKEWNSNKKTIDKNGDNILQYFMLKGSNNNNITTSRSLNSILAINNAGIKTQEVGSIYINSDKELAKNAMESFFFKYGNAIESIISNNDDMAIGAIETLQKYGYNKDDKSKYIPIFGIDGTPQALDLINKGIMTGTVIQDPNELSQALYTVGMNLVNNKHPLNNTDYSFDETGVTIQMPYHEYIK